MARPLTKRTAGGALYTRPHDVEAQIDEAIYLSRSDLQCRLSIADRTAPSYLRSECLVHLVREGRRSGDQQVMSAVLPVLLGRCEAILLRKVPDGGMPDAAGLRQQILEELTDLFVTDGTGNISNELDFYECRFNLAFRTLRVGAVERDVRRRKREIDFADLPPFETAKQPDAYEDAFARVSDAFKIQPTQEWDALGEELGEAIAALPADERDAVVLVRGLGYKVESVDPDKETAATRCNCSGRTIRTRLASAAEMLARFKEEI